MRLAILAFAFDLLGAAVAISSARADNAASLAVSRRCGYAPNGVSVIMTPTGSAPLQHFRLTAEPWGAAGTTEEVTVNGLDECRPWFGAGAD